jgi:hypothetical protein
MDNPSKESRLSDTKDKKKISLRDYRPIYDDSKKPEWLYTNFSPRVTSCEEVILPIKDGPNKKKNETEKAQVFKIRSTSLYKGHLDHPIENNGEFYIILPKNISLYFDSHGIIFTQNGFEIRNFKASLYIRGGLANIGELNNEWMAGNNQLVQKLALEYGYVVVAPRFPASLGYKEYDISSKVKKDPNPREIYKELSFNENYTLPPVIGADDQFWARFAAISDSANVVGFDNISNIIGGSSGASTALLLCDNLSKIGMEGLPNLRSVIAMAPPLDIKSSFRSRIPEFKEMYESHFSVNSLKAAKIRSPDILEISQKYPDTKFVIVQGGLDQQLDCRPFLSQKKLIDRIREKDHNAYSNLNLIFVQGGLHDVGNLYPLNRKYYSIIEEYL